MAAGSQVERHRRSQLKVMLQCPPFLFFVWSGSTCNTAPAFSYLTGMRKNSALSPVGRARLSNLMAPALKPWKQVCQSMLNSRPSRSSSSICGESVVLLSWCCMLLSSACISASVRGSAPSSGNRAQWLDLHTPSAGPSPACCAWGYLCWLLDPNCLSVRGT